MDLAMSHETHLTMVVQKPTTKFGGGAMYIY